MKRILLLLVLIGTTWAQCQTISGSDTDREWLEKRVFEKIDSIRQKSKRGNLEADALLYLAAENQAHYIAGKGKLSHTQTNRDYKDPQKRAEFFGTTGYLVGENVMWTDYNVSITSDKGKKFDGRNLEQLANAIVTIWKESPGHYQNMLDKRYTRSAVAIVFDPVKKRVYACQVFAYPESD